jgi:hypothetical protein
MKNVPSFIKWAFAAAFIIITNLFFYYAISFVSPEPKIEGFCPVRTEQYMTAELCVGAGGQWQSFNYSPKQTTDSIKSGEPTGWCDADFTCRQDFETVQSTYNKNVFIAMIIISIAMIVGGVLVAIEVLSLGMVWSGVLALLIATVRFWSDANNLMKVIILAIGIAVLVLLAVKKMNHKE